MQDETNRKVFLRDGTYRKVLMDVMAQAWAPWCRTGAR